MEIYSNSEKFKGYILLPNEKERTVTNIGNLLGYDDTTIGRQLREFNLENLVYEGKSTSQYETEIYNFLINDINISAADVIKNTKSILSNKKEIDIYIISKKFGIEFNDSYWHSEALKSSKYHQNKSVQAEKDGLSLNFRQK